MSHRLTLLLPAAARFGAQRLQDRGLQRALGRADSDKSGEEGEDAQLLRHFDVLPRRLPIAALTRQLDAGDAAGACWLRADPAHVRADVNGARLIGIGPMLGVGQEDVDALMPALKPLFGDAGVPIEATAPDRWYIRLPSGAGTPSFASPAQALGEDLTDHLTGGDSDARRWRTLLSEAQIVLHNHPWNERRAARNLPRINGLWFWGGGELPDHVSTRFERVYSDDPSLLALAAVASSGKPLPATLPALTGGSLVDLRGERDLRRVEQDWLLPALQGAGKGAISRLALDLEDGRRWEIARRQRWRFWRRPVVSFAP